MRLAVQSPGGPPREIDVETKIEMGKRFMDLTEGEDIWDILRQAENGTEIHRFADTADKGIFIWHVPSFRSEESELKRLAGRLPRYKSVVIDLRGNSGGYESSLKCLLGFFFDHDVTIAQPTGRAKNMKPMIAKTQGTKAFTGKVVVIVDSDSGSAAELFARVIQLEKRGVVVGDRSAGAVMRSRVYTRQTAGEYVVLYGISITESDVIMADGKSLENEGVIPDQIALPSGEDLAAGRDPVLARAVLLAGGLLPPVEAAQGGTTTSSGSPTPLPKRTPQTVTNTGVHMIVIVEVAPEEAEVIRWAQREETKGAQSYMTMGLVLRSDKDNDAPDVKTLGITFRELVTRYGVLPPDARGIIPADLARQFSW